LTVLKTFLSKYFAWLKISKGSKVLDAFRPQKCGAVFREKEVEHANRLRRGFRD
jgi:hypothetical protein